MIVCSLFSHMSVTTVSVSVIHLETALCFIICVSYGLWFLWSKGKEHYESIFNFHYWNYRSQISLFKKNTKSIVVFRISDMILQVWCKDSRGDKQTNAWLGAAGHVIRTERTVFKIRKALPKSVFNWCLKPQLKQQPNKEKGEYSYFLINREK